MRTAQQALAARNRRIADLYRARRAIDAELERIRHPHREPNGLWVEHVLADAQELLNQLNANDRKRSRGGA